MNRKSGFLLFLYILVSSVSLSAQESGDPIADPFADPFAELEDLFADPFADPFGESNGAEIQNSDDPFSDMFSDVSMIDDGVSEQGQPAGDDLLTQDTIRIGGRISGSVNTDWNWNQPFAGEFSLWNPNSQSLTPVLRSDLFFDARPARDYRGYIKLRITTGDGGGGGGLGNVGVQVDTDFDIADLEDDETFTVLSDGTIQVIDADGNIVQTFSSQVTPLVQEQGESEPSLGTAPGLSLSIIEAFMDFSWEDRLLFRFGKHTITWGVGYFWSPADVLNLSAVNAEDPTAEREGPVSLKSEFPFGIGNALTLYTITNTGAEPLDIALAPRVDLLLGNFDLGLGGYYQRTLAPRIIGVTRFTIGEIDFFGEVIGSYGSDKVFVKPSMDQSPADDEENPGLELVLETYEDKTRIYFSGTAGFRYLKDFENLGSFLTVGQYYFNGEGYSRTIGGYPNTRVLPAAYRLFLNPSENGLTPDPEDPDGIAPPTLNLGSLGNFGRHYGGLVVGLSNILDSSVGLNLALLMNLSDFSTIASPSISFSLIDVFTLSLGTRFTFGPAGGEFTDPLGLFTQNTTSRGTVGVTFTVSMQGSSF